MEKYLVAREKALQNIKIADHILHVTYPLLKDPKLLLSVTDNIFLALANAMGAILYYESHYKELPFFEDNFSSKFELFKKAIAGRRGIAAGYIPFIQDIKDIVVAHKKSPVEFVRKQSLVICSDSYQIRKLTSEEAKGHLQKARSFVHLMNSWVQNSPKTMYFG